MQNRQRDRQVAKALLLSAGLLAVPAGTVAAAGAEQETPDVFATQEAVDQLLEAADVRKEQAKDQEKLSEASAPSMEDADGSEAYVTLSETDASSADEGASATEQDDAANVADDTASTDLDETDTPEANATGATEQETAVAETASTSSASPVANGTDDTIEPVFAYEPDLVVAPDDDIATEEGEKTDATSGEPNAFSEVPGEGTTAGSPKEAVLAKAVTIQAPPKTVRAAAVVGGFLQDSKGKVLKNCWIEYKGEYYFTNAKGYAYANQFITFGPKIAYYLDGKGRLARGVQTIQGNKMLLDESTAILHKDNAWVEQSDGVYFPNAKGVLYHDQFITFGPKVSYYMDSDGRKAEGVIRKGDKMYLLDESRGGQLRKDNAWVTYRQKHYFPNAMGELYHDQFITFGKKGSFYMGADATRQGGVVKAKDNRLYLMEAQTDKLIQEVKPGLNVVQGKNVYIDPKTLKVDNEYTMAKEDPTGTTVVKNQDVVVAGKHYYMGPNGTAQAGFHEVNGKLYFYDPTLANQRREASGMFSWQGKDYYVKRDGTVSRSEVVVVNKQTYKTDANGVMRASKEGLVLDVSRYQDPNAVDFDTLSQHISGVILRAGYTGWGAKSLYADQTFDRYYQEFTKRGIPVGAYWFSCAQNAEDGKKEAEKMLELVGNKKLEMPLFWDTESEERQRELPKSVLTDAGLSFLTTLEDAGYYVGIYASTSWLNEKLDMSRLKDYDVWVAHYGVAQPTYQGDYDMWQFTSSYRLPGYDGNLDASWSYVDYPSIIRRAGLNHL